MEEKIQGFRLAVDRDFCELAEDLLVEGLILNEFIHFTDI